MFLRLDLKNRDSRLIDSRPACFAAHEGHYRSFIHEAQFIDKNSLWGGLNIQKKELCVKGILAQDLGFVMGPFQGEFGGFSE